MQRLIALILLLSPALPSLAAEERKDLFADPQNLKVLPEDISSDALRATMREFAISLGVCCETCHDGEPGQPLETFDFASDKKDTKKTARQMLRMVEAINRDHIALLDEARLEVRCITCHRGVRLPMTTGQALSRVIEEEGVAAAVARYRELRERYHGTHSYDFSEGVLGNLAQTLSRNGDASGAMQLLELNDEYFPRSFRNHWLKGEVALHSGDEAAAREYLQTALEIGADERSEAFVRQRLSTIGG